MNKRITTALAATMVCALTLGLAGCEGQVPQTVAPSVKDNEIIDVTVAQEKQIRGKILDVLNQANEAKSADGLAARVSGSQLEIRTAQLNIAQYTQQDVTPLATVPSDVTQVVIPTDNAWPRYIFTVTTTTEDGRTTSCGLSPDCLRTCHCRASRPLSRAMSWAMPTTPIWS